jgi:hypothetical protein
MNHPPDGISRYRELIAVAISQIDGDPIVGDRLVDPALEITVAHFKKIIALQRAGRRNPMTHENAEDLTANILVGRSFKHRSTIGFARRRSYGRTATVDKIAQPLAEVPLGESDVCFARQWMERMDPAGIGFPRSWPWQVSLKSKGAPGKPKQWPVELRAR